VIKLIIVKCRDCRKEFLCNAEKYCPSKLKQSKSERECWCRKCAVKEGFDKKEDISECYSTKPFIFR
jgi:hypothetical protein